MRTAMKSGTVKVMDETLDDEILMREMFDDDGPLELGGAPDDAAVDAGGASKARTDAWPSPQTARAGWSYRLGGWASAGGRERARPARGAIPRRGRRARGASGA